MFFTKFDPLTPEYVEENAKAIGRAAGDSCPCLKGMKFTVKLEGEFAPKKLSYEITDKRSSSSTKTTRNTPRLTPPSPRAPSPC